MKNNTLLFSAILIVTSASILSCASSKPKNFSNFVARMEVKEPIQGVCDNSNVIVILPFPNNGQEKAQCPKSKEDLIKELNDKAEYLKSNPNYNDSASLTVIINCEGDMVRCQLDRKTQKPEIDQQIISVFQNLKKWVPGKINKKPIDTVELYSIKIKNGIISF